MKNLSTEEELKKLINSIKKLEDNSLELDLILNAILKKSDKLNYLDRAILNKHMKKHIDLEEKVEELRS